jgi:hypothetical protein
MKTNKRLFCIIFVLLFVSSAYAESPDRSKGISVHALPQRVAKLSGKPWGLEVSYAPYLKPEPGIPFLQSKSDVLQYIRKQDPSVIQNGFWVVTTNPGAYSKEEIEFQEQIKEVLPKENIPLFWARGAELEKGFTRY